MGGSWGRGTLHPLRAQWQLDAAVSARDPKGRAGNVRLVQIQAWGRQGMCLSRANPLAGMLQGCSCLWLPFPLACAAWLSHPIPSPWGHPSAPQKAELQGDFLGRLSCLNASYMIYLFMWEC